MERRTRLTALAATDDGMKAQREDEQRCWQDRQEGRMRDNSRHLEVKCDVRTGCMDGVRGTVLVMWPKVGLRNKAVRQSNVSHPLVL